MNQSFGNDQFGKFVLWQTKLPMEQYQDIFKDNRKYLDGPFAGEHIGYNPATGEEFYAGHDMPRNSDKRNPK